MALRRLNDALAQVLETQRRAHVETALRPTRVEARNDDGTLRVRPLDGECIATAPPSNLYVGQEFITPPNAPFRLQGAAGIAMVSQSRVFTRPHLISFTPDFWLRGGQYLVAIEGRGLTDAYLQDLLLPASETINDGVTVETLTVLSDTTAEMLITVGANAALVRAAGGDVAYESP